MVKSRLSALWRRPAWRVVAIFVAVPAAVFGIPAALGLPWLVGDNVIQNYPLRVLVGTDLSHGHLPLWDPYLWSGSPLLAGFNAGALYPFTALFAALPDMLAWFTNQVVVEVVASLGVVVLLRGHGRSWLATGLGAAAFSYGGFMAAQSVHIDLVEAAGWLVWAFAALDRMADPALGRRRLGWTAMLGLSLGMMALTGAAEPLLDGAVALVMYSLWLLWRAGRERVAFALHVVAGVAVGALIGAAQLLPGSVLQGESQRAGHTLAYFLSGSMNKSFLLLLFDPLLLGGSHPVPLGFIGTYNLPEISSYVGILPVMAVFGLLARRHRRHPEAARWWIWYAIGAVGLLLALGGFTPLGHLEYLAPLYNRQRLLARNLMEVDLALVVLFAAWVDHTFLAPAPAAAAVPQPRRRWRAWPSDVVLPLVPVAAVVVLQLAMITVGPWMTRLMRTPLSVSYGNLWRQDLFLTVPTAIALAAGALVVGARRLRRHVGRWLVILVVADLALFNAIIQVDPLQSAIGDRTQSNALSALVEQAGPGPGGELHRVALYDPDRYYPDQAAKLGEPDLGVLTGLDSVQGYGAIVDSRYDAVTGTHLQDNVSPPAMADGTMAGLDLGVLVTVPEYFVHLVEPLSGVPSSTLAGAVALPPVGPRPELRSPHQVAPPTPSGAFDLASPAAPLLSLAPGRPDTQYFGTVLSVRSVRIPLLHAEQGSETVRLGLVLPDGTGVRWIEGPGGIEVAGDLRVAVPDVPAAGIVVELLPATTGVGPAALTMGWAVVDTAGQGTYRVDGSLRDVVTGPAWHFAGRVGVFSAFSDSDAAGRAFLTDENAGTAVVQADPAWGTQVVEVRTTRPTTLVRDEAFATGWQASISSPQGGDDVSAVVQRHGLVQAVRVPAGTHLVTFRYRPHRVDEGLALSAAGLLVAVALVIAGRRRPRLRRRTPAAPT